MSVTGYMCRFFVPKYARRESMFFKELKKQDEESEDQKQDGCEDEVEKESGVGGCVDEEGENPTNDCGEVLTEPVSTETASQLDNLDDDDDDVTGFTSLQSGTSFTLDVCAVSIDAQEKFHAKKPTRI